jgi:hypothetical protein
MVRVLEGDVAGQSLSVAVHQQETDGGAALPSSG